MAKEKLHPELYNTKIFCDGKIVLELKTPKKEIHVEVWSGNHPFYTGSHKFLDFTGRVEKFKKKYKDNQ